MGDANLIIWHRSVTTHATATRVLMRHAHLSNYLHACAKPCMDVHALLHAGLHGDPPTNWLLLQEFVNSSLTCKIPGNTLVGSCMYVSETLACKSRQPFLRYKWAKFQFLFFVFFSASFRTNTKTTLHCIWKTLHTFVIHYYWSATPSKNT